MKSLSLVIIVLSYIAAPGAFGQTKRPEISGGQNSGGGRTQVQGQSQSSDGNQSSYQSGNSSIPGSTQEEGVDVNGGHWQRQSQMQHVDPAKAVSASLNASVSCADLEALLDSTEEQVSSQLMVANQNQADVIYLHAQQHNQAIEQVRKEIKNLCTRQNRN